MCKHPWLVTAISTHLMYGPGKARRDDHCLAVFEAAGFVGVHADNASKTVLTYVLGTALSEVAEAAWRARLHRNGGNEEEQVGAAMAQASEIAMRFPRLRARLEKWEEADATAPPDKSFELGLQAILDGLESQLTARPAPTG
ncbi:TetR/AcrR family transcriptional regulator C-terminal domain-containing protein [Nonomuraea sp. NPDC050680]|uniref:TetR/AcrR family transcriptional regulator C-terminal domain-containing protein n=1 Tax=Nonomuraea sp. NPDC050680 TaxID=3154630 RepID=UPI0033E75A90